jgi:hypothetical protein
LEASTGANQHGHGQFAHEKTDTGVNNVAVLAGAFVGLLIFGLIVGYGTFRFLSTPETATVVPSLTQTGRALPPGPRLQVNAQEDLRDYVQQQQQTLESYGWVDQGAGVARIPIDRAMDLLLERGLPVRSAAGGSAGASAGRTAGKSPAGSAMPGAQPEPPAARP